MFRNLRYYHIDSVWPDSEDAVSEHLAKAGFKTCGPLTERSSGWVPVDPDTGNSLARRLHGADLFRLRSQSRVLPNAVINEELENRIEEYRSRMNEAPPPREKRRLKAETKDELLPKALLKSERIWGYVDLKEKVLGIDASQNAAVERFLLRMRTPFDDLVVRPLQFMKPVNDLLTKIFLGDAPQQFALGRECKMQDAGEVTSVVRWSQFDLSDKTIRNHVANGMRLTHLAIEYDNVLSFVLDENGAISKLKFIGVEDDNADEFDPLAKMDAEFVLMAGTMRLLLADLKKLLGGFVKP